MSETPEDKQSPPPGDEPAEFRIEQVDVEDVRPLRHKHLRPDQTEDAVCYQSDSEETCCHFAAKDLEGRVIGTGSLNREDRVAGLPPFGSPGMRIRGMTVEDEYRGRGVGTALVARMLEHGKAMGIAEAWGNARTDNLRFYLRNGFVEVSSSFDIPTMGEHVVVALNLEPKGRKARKERKARSEADGDGAEPGAEAEAGA